jgi:hypothetical protein
MLIAVAARLGPEFARILDEEVAAISTALRGAVEGSAGSLQDDLRAQVRAAGLGAGLANAWRREIYPRGRRHSLRPAALVYSKATALHDAFASGAVVLPRVGSFLLVPTAAAERLGVTTTTRARKGGTVPGGQRRHLADLDLAASKLGAPIVSAVPGRKRASSRGDRDEHDRGFILLTPARRSRSTLVALYYARRDAQPVHLFTLVRSTRVPKLLDLTGAVAAAEQELGATAARALAGS